MNTHHRREAKFVSIAGPGPSRSFVPVHDRSSPFTDGDQEYWHLLDSYTNYGHEALSSLPLNPLQSLMEVHDGTYTPLSSRPPPNVHSFPRFPSNFNSALASSSTSRPNSRPHIRMGTYFSSRPSDPDNAVATPKAPRPAMSYDFRDAVRTCQTMYAHRLISTIPGAGSNQSASHIPQVHPDISVVDELIVPETPSPLPSPQPSLPHSNASDANGPDNREDALFSSPVSIMGPPFYQLSTSVTHGSHSNISRKFNIPLSAPLTSGQNPTKAVQQSTQMAPFNFTLRISPSASMPPPLTSTSTSAVPPSAPVSTLTIPLTSLVPPVTPVVPLSTSISLPSTLITTSTSTSTPDSLFTHASSSSSAPTSPPSSFSEPTLLTDPAAMTISDADMELMKVLAPYLLNGDIASVPLRAPPGLPGKNVYEPLTAEERAAHRADSKKYFAHGAEYACTHLKPRAPRKSRRKSNNEVELREERRSRATTPKFGPKSFQMGRKPKRIEERKKGEKDGVSSGGGNKEGEEGEKDDQEEENHGEEEEREVEEEGQEEEQEEDRRTATKKRRRSSRIRSRTNGLGEREDDEYRVAARKRRKAVTPRNRNRKSEPDGKEQRQSPLHRPHDRSRAPSPSSLPNSITGSRCCLTPTRRLGTQGKPLSLRVAH